MKILTETYKMYHFINFKLQKFPNKNSLIDLIKIFSLHINWLEEYEKFIPQLLLLENSNLSHE